MLYVGDVSDKHHNASGFHWAGLYLTTASKLTKPAILPAR